MRGVPHHETNQLPVLKFVESLAPGQVGSSPIPLKESTSDKGMVGRLGLKQSFSTLAQKVLRDENQLEGDNCFVKLSQAYTPREYPGHLHE